METVSIIRTDKLRWVTLILLMLVGTSSAYVNCISVYIGPLAEKGWSPEIVVVAYTVMMFMTLPGFLFGGWLKKVFGNRLVLKIGGVGLAASGAAAAFAPSAIVYVVLMGGFAPFFVYCIYVAQLGNVGELFPDKRGFAMGITVAGIALASALMLPFSEWLTRTIGVTSSIAFTGLAVGGITFLIGFLVVEAPENYKPAGWEPKDYEVLDANNAEKEGTSAEVSWQKVLKRASFWLILLGIFSCGIMTVGLQSNFFMVTSSLVGTTDAQSAWVFSLLTIMTGGSGFIIGFISDKTWGPVKTVAIAFLAIALAATIFLVSGGQNFVLFIILIALLGFGLGAVQTLIPDAIMTAWGSKYFGINYGLCNFGLTLAAVVAPQLTVRTSVFQFFIIGTIGMLVAGLVLVISSKSLNKELGKKIF